MWRGILLAILQVPILAVLEGDAAYKSLRCRVVF